MAINPIDLLEALGPRARATFKHLTEQVDLPAGQTLFRQGATPDAMYLVVAGSLGVYVYGPAHEHQLIALIGSGETVGEMGVISGAPRSATIIAIRDCELLKLTKAHFDLLQKREPKLMVELNRILVHRLRQSTRGTKMRLEPRMTAILPAVETVQTEIVARRLASLMEAEGENIRIIGPHNPKRPTKWFAEQESKHDHVFLCASLDSHEWIRISARQADRIIVVARANDPVQSSLTGDFLQQRANHQLLDLVLLHENPALMPVNTSAWLDLLPVIRHFHIREHEPDDWARLARVVRGHAVGLVLSGGGARAYAHIGALRAIMEHKVDFDFIGGTSMGAIIGANLAMDWSIDDIADHIQQTFVHSSPLSDLTLPLISLFKGRKVDQLLENHFGNLEIPDLQLPFYCVSSNLSDGTLYVHRKGRVRDALRASVALPGVLPPVIADDRVLVDGAVLNNLPVDVMRGLHRGPIIAIDVTRDRALTPEMLALSQSHRRFWFDHLRNPPIVSIMMRAGTVSSDVEIERQASNASLVIEPPLGDIDIHDWSAFDRAVSIGYEHTAKILPRSLKLLRRLRRIRLE